MAHFARLENNVVVQVIVVGNDDCKDANGVEREEIGVAFCQNLFGGEWKQTSYNGSFRRHYAGIGFTYDSVRDAFIPPSPFPSWILNEQSLTWDPPVPYPGNGDYYWSEEDLQWKPV